MSGPTNHALKRALEEIALNIVRTTEPVDLASASACAFLANSPTVLTMLANKLEQPAKQPSFGEWAITLAYLSRVNACEHFPAVKIQFANERDLSFFKVGLRKELDPLLLVGNGLRDPEQVLRDGFTYAGIHFKLVVERVDPPA